MSDHRGLCRAIERAQWRFIGRCVDIVRQRIRRSDIDSAEVNEVTADLHIELGEESLADRTSRDTGRRFASRRSLEQVPGVIASGFEPPCEIGGAGTHARHGSPASFLTVGFWMRQ